MAEFLRRKELSLDTNLVLDLAEEKNFAHEFRELFQSRHYTLLLPPTALHELSTIEFEGETERERKLARTGLTHLRTWEIQAFDLDSIAEAVSRRFVQSLLRRRLIPEEEFN